MKKEIGRLQQYSVNVVKNRRCVLNVDLSNDDIESVFKQGDIGTKTQSATGSEREQEYFIMNQKPNPKPEIWIKLYFYSKNRGWG